MESKIYALFSSIGYHHPLHPALTHLPVGLTIAGFIFLVLSYLVGNQKYAQTAMHCIVLAILAAIPTMIFGYFDWQHFYGGTLIFPIKMKLGLAFLLLILLFITISITRRNEQKTSLRLLFHFCSLVIVIGLGYFGGELVYGNKTVSTQPISENPAQTESAMAGKNLFEKNCSFCHFTDSTDTKVGPGLKGLFKLEKMPVSEWAVTPKNVQRQLKTPFDQMPPFDKLSDVELKALTDFLQTL
jgi:uncharacterized membrane protein